MYKMAYSRKNSELNSNYSHICTIRPTVTEQNTHINSLKIYLPEFIFAFSSLLMGYSITSHHPEKEILHYEDRAIIRYSSISFHIYD